MSFVLCSNPEKENSYHVTNAAIKLVRVVLEVGLREAKEFAEKIGEMDEVVRRYAQGLRQPELSGD